jgi:hypothetical protein
MPVVAVSTLPSTVVPDPGQVPGALPSARPSAWSLRLILSVAMRDDLPAESDFSSPRGRPHLPNAEPEQIGAVSAKYGIEQVPARGSPVRVLATLVAR